MYCGYQTLLCIVSLIQCIIYLVKNRHVLEIFEYLSEILCLNERYYAYYNINVNNKLDVECSFILFGI